MSAYLEVGILVTVLATAALIVLAVRSGCAKTAAELQGRLQATAADLAAARDNKAAADQRLAVAEERVSRIAALEQSLANANRDALALRDDKAGCEARLAATVVALGREETVHNETKVRLGDAERSLTELTARVTAMRDEKGKLEELVASKTEAISGLDAQVTDLRARLNDATLRLESAQRDITIQKTDLAALTETLNKERQNAEEKLLLLTEAKVQMTQEFKLLAESIMREHGETFSKQNKEQVEATLAPLREKLAEYEKGLQDAHIETVKERAQLGEQIRQLADTSTRMSTETLNLTRALKGNAQAQGAWGEMILDSILTRSGLREGEHYTRQESHTTEEGQRLRSDVIVKLPNGDRIVIDSKVSLVAFEAYVTADDEIVKAEYLKGHIGSLKTHVKGLSSKEYHTAADSRLDYVIMFVPIEGALAAALESEPDLSGQAVDCGVAIATPTTLMIALRTAASIWKVEQRNETAALIANRAGALYNKFVSFVESLNEIGLRLDQAKAAFDIGKSRLSSGRGNLVWQVEELKTLGARTGKALPANLLLSEDREDQPTVMSTLEEGAGAA